MTKSGGLHVYFFFRRKQPAKKVQDFLTQMGYLLGFSDFEVFPKQNNISTERQANWINLPYFGDTRHCYIDGQKLDVKEFYEETKNKKIDNFETILKRFQFSGAPPCIMKLTTQGIVRGYRDIALLNIGVFFQKKFDNWQEQLKKYNKKLDSPIKETELETNIIRQLEKGVVFYQCKTELADYCDEKNCNAKESFLNSIDFGKIQRLDTQPPVWIVEIEKKTIKFSSEELLTQRKFKIKVFDYCSIIIPTVKSSTWEKFITEKLEDLEIQEAPPDASEDNEFYSTLEEYCCRMSNTRNDSDVLNGKVIIHKDRNYFKSTGLRNYFKKKGLSNYKNNKCFEFIKEIGGGSDVKRIEDRIYRLWFVPMYDEQKVTKKQKKPDFKKYDEKDIF
jgi:hypothetical protein